MSDIESNLAQVREAIAEAAQRSGRDPEAVVLVAVTKTFSADVVLAAYEAGVRHFGENRVGEGISKITAIEPYISDQHPTWHMVGHVQSRKASRVVEYYDYVHSVDRLKIARRLSRYADEAERTIPVLLECNISGEGSKYGFALENWEQDEALEGTLLWKSADVLLVTGGPTSSAYSSEDGTLLWNRRLPGQPEPVIIGDTIYLYPRAFDLRTGEWKTRAHPVTGEDERWLDRQHGAPAAASSAGRWGQDRGRR